MKHKEIRLLSHGLFEKPFMDSKVTSRSVSTKEKILGHLIGPLGLIFVVNTIAALVEKFFTQQTGAMYGTTNADMVVTMGERYEVVITVAKILAVLLGLFNGWLIQHTQSRQGRMRPWNLICFNRHRLPDLSFSGQYARRVVLVLLFLFADRL